MARVDTLSHFLSDVASAIRKKTGKSDLIDAKDFDTEIASISGGGDLDTEEYMLLSDLLEYPIPIDEENYTQEYIDETDELIEHFATLGDDTNGE